MVSTRKSSPSRCEKKKWNHHLAQCKKDIRTFCKLVATNQAATWILGFFFWVIFLIFCEKLSWRDEGLSVVAATPPRKISKILIWEVFRSFVTSHPAGLWMLTVHIACNSLAKPYHWVISSHTLLKHGFNHCSSWISSSKIPQELRTIQ